MEEVWKDTTIPDMLKTQREILRELGGTYTEPSQLEPGFPRDTTIPQMLEVQRQILGTVKDRLGKEEETFTNVPEFRGVPAVGQIFKVSAVGDDGKITMEPADLPSSAGSSGVPSWKKILDLTLEEEVSTTKMNIDDLTEVICFIKIEKADTERQMVSFSPWTTQDTPSDAVQKLMDSQNTGIHTGFAYAMKIDQAVLKVASSSGSNNSDLSVRGNTIDFGKALRTNFVDNLFIISTNLTFPVGTNILIYGR